MRLLDLDPRWFVIRDRAGAVGVTFDCPVHPEHRLSVPFSNPLDGGAAVPGDDGHVWDRSGETFENLTLTPSVDASRHFWPYEVNNKGEVVRLADSSSCWHGHVTRGDIT